MLRLASCLVVVALFVSTAQAVEIETVPVGNPGNDPDTRYATPGYGGVSYAYNIGKYEVTAGQYTEFLNKVGGVDKYGLYKTSMWSSTYGCKIERSDNSGTEADPYQYQVAAEYANRPVNYVSWGDAARFSNWLHNGQPIGFLTGTPVLDAGLTEDGAYDLNGATDNRGLLAVTRQSDWKWAITSEDEWYKAAYHKNDGDTANYWDYPTESDIVPTAESPSGTDLVNGSANYRDGGFVDGTYYRTEVGAYDMTDQGEYVSDSPYDTFDQVGNVWEWNEAILYGSFRGLRGGSFFFKGIDLRASSRGYFFVDPPLEAIDFGFRVASIPEPGSITLLVCGLVAGLIWWRRKK